MNFKEVIFKEIKTAVKKSLKNSLKAKDLSKQTRSLLEKQLSELKNR